MLRDTNVFLDRQDEVDDTAVAAQYGLRFVHESDIVRATGHLFGYVEDYDKAKAANDHDFGARLNLTIGRADALQLQLEPAYRQTNERDFETGSIEGRDIGDFKAILLKKITDKLDGEIHYLFNSTAYDDPALFARREHTVLARVHHRLTDKTSLFLGGAIAHQTSDGSPDNDQLSLFAGFKSKTLSKLEYDLGAGWRDDSETGAGQFAFDAHLSWRATDKIGVTLGARNQVVPSAQAANQFNLQHVVDLELAYAVTDAFRLTLRGAYHRNDLDGTAVIDGESRDRKNDTYTAYARLEYSPRARPYGLFAEAQYEERDSTLDDSYDQFVTAIGVILRY